MGLNSEQKMMREKRVLAIVEDIPSKVSGGGDGVVVSELEEGENLVRCGLVFLDKKVEHFLNGAVGMLRLSICLRMIRGGQEEVRP